MGARNRQRRGRRRRWCVPPAVMRAPGERMEGSGILAELSGDLGTLLWRTSRDVMLWGETPLERRGELFADGSAEVRAARLMETAIPSPISAAVSTIHGMLALGARADGHVLSLCCLDVAAWAHKGGLLETAVTFAQAGALAAPEVGRAALQTGIYARAAGQLVRAETWFRRTVAVARRERDWRAYSSALVEAAALSEDREDTLRADRLYRLAMRAALRYGPRAVRMRAAHGLFRIARRQGDDASAAQFALDVQRSCAPDTAGAQELLLDLARYWTEVGEPARASVALQRLDQALVTMPPAERLAVFALLARARIEEGDVPASGPAAGAAWALLADDGIPETVRYVAAVDLAHASRVAGHLCAFKRAERLVLLLAPQASFPDAVKHMAELWPEAERMGSAAGSAEIARLWLEGEPTVPTPRAS